MLSSSGDRNEPIATFYTPTHKPRSFYIRRAISALNSPSISLTNNKSNIYIGDEPYCEHSF